MRSPRRRGPFDETPDSSVGRLLPALSVMVGSCVTIWPTIASFPFLPPVGLLMLLAWRLNRREAIPVWAPLALGLFDDLVSGQPFGLGITTWTLCFFMIDLIDERLVFRDFWQNWLIAAGGTAFYLICGRLVAVPFGTHVDTVLLLQVTTSVLLFPVISLLCAWLDRDYEPA
ncbi:rod shape-determining protein MreD [Sphingomonas populi]|uniref:Rod shape-determining protein MreD n=1 Tax=Sphingomonas populi TaxID=2484750 RepID=A0A4Q6Y8E1_9SPHN|nr:rod shape-determining protein MreD [Sphingomonas populi]RZF65907.1 rod shape-determining protein MreD [Sphingomonas populi]